MIDSLGTWTTTYAAIPYTLDSTWTTNISNWVDARVTNKAQVTDVTHAVPPFTFDKATFKTELDALILTLSQADGATQYATAWANAVTTSTLTTQSGDYTGSPDPSTTWSSIDYSIIEPASIASAKATLITNLTNAIYVWDINNSLIPQYLRQAFLDLTCAISGMNTETPSNPLTVTGKALI